MKLNKLLTPILGLTTLSTVVVPLTTACSSENVEHVKVSPKSLEVNAKDKKSTYLLILDRNDYDVNGFKVTTTVSKDDKTGVINSDFESEWEIDGGHLVVYVTYIGEYEPETDINVKLNINVSYGTQWNQTLDVKMGYEILKPTNMKWNGEYYYTDVYTAITNSSYMFSADCSYIDELEASEKPTTFHNSIVGGSRMENINICGFKNIIVKLNGKVVEKDGNYVFRTNDFITTDHNICGVIFNESFVKDLGKGDILTLLFEDCIAYNVNTSYHTITVIESCDFCEVTYG